MISDILWLDGWNNINNRNKNHNLRYSSSVSRTENEMNLCFLNGGLCCLMSGAEE